jgi:hypothetical protein
MYLIPVSALTFRNVVGTTLINQQIGALLKKRVIYTCREWKSVIIRVSNFYNLGKLYFDGLS